MTGVALLLLVILSAALLFVTELASGKAFTSRLGGSASAWLVLLGCYQVTLLLGYIYAWWQAQRPRWWLHVGLVLLCCVWWLFRIVGGDPWGDGDTQAPLWWTLRTFMSSVLVIGFLTSTTVTLAQAQVAPERRHGLYAASNLGSFLALAGYPLVIEPLFGLGVQMALISGMLSLVAVGHLCLLHSRITGEAAVAAAAPVPWGQVARIVWWALLASAFLTTATAWATLDIAPMPLMWALLLAAYLASFVVVFGPLRDMPLFAWDVLAAAGLVACVWLDERGFDSALVVAVAVWLVACALHARIANDYPTSRHGLGNIAMATGGAAGGLSMAVLPPLCFAWRMEWPLVLLLIAGTVLLELRWRGDGRFPRLRRCGVLVLAAATIGLSLPSWWSRDTVILQDRDFYGDWSIEQLEEGVSVLRSGRIVHGAWGDPEYWTYYDPQGPFGSICRVVQNGKQEPLRVLLVGLGAGTALRYLQAGDTAEIAEISPALLNLYASDPPWIPSIRDCPAEVRVHAVDGRQLMEQQRATGMRYGLVILDAFTSDVVPNHLLTTEALGLMMELLEENGLLLLHTSNNHIEVASIVFHAASALRQPAVYLVDSEESRMPTNWVALGHTDILLDAGIRRFVSSQTGLDKRAGWEEVSIFQPSFTAWTDDHSSILAFLRLSR
ncbi:MAG: hypothetical protein ACOCXA_06400 [Planctomycetota bacterium]